MDWEVADWGDWEVADWVDSEVAGWAAGSATLVEDCMIDPNYSLQSLRLDDHYSVS